MVTLELTVGMPTEGSRLLLLSSDPWLQVYSQEPSLALASVRQTVCDLSRKLALGNTHPDPGGKKPASRNKELSMAPKLMRN